MMSNSTLKRGPLVVLPQAAIGLLLPFSSVSKSLELSAPKTLKSLGLVPWVGLEPTRPILSNLRILSPANDFAKHLISQRYSKFKFRSGPLGGLTTGRHSPTFTTESGKTLEAISAWIASPKHNLETQKVGSKGGSARGNYESARKDHHRVCQKRRTSETQRVQA